MAKLHSLGLVIPFAIAALVALIEELYKYRRDGLGAVIGPILFVYCVAHGILAAVLRLVWSVVPVEGGGVYQLATPAAFGAALVCGLSSATVSRIRLSAPQAASGGREIGRTWKHLTELLELAIRRRVGRHEMITKHRLALALAGQTALIVKRVKDHDPSAAYLAELKATEDLEGQINLVIRAEGTAWVKAMFRDELRHVRRTARSPSASPSTNGRPVFRRAARVGATLLVIATLVLAGFLLAEWTRTPTSLINYEYRGRLPSVAPPR